MFLHSKNFIVGRNPVIEALQQNVSIDKILLFRNASGEQVSTIKTLAKEKNIPIQPVPIEKLNKLTNTQHQGVLAFRAAVSFYDLQDVIDLVIGNGDTPLFLILDGITDVRNIGAIARSAVCCGAQALIIPDKGVAALGADAMKSSAGALAHIHICRVNSLMKAADTLHLNGISVYASEMTAAANLASIPLKEPIALVMGSEENGVFNGLMKICDGSFKIPMKGNFESLNVSVAAGIILYEAMKQRMG